MRPSLHNTTLLPRQLREELGLKDTYKPGESTSRPRTSGSSTPRKERRKAERAQIKGRVQRQRDSPRDNGLHQGVVSQTSRINGPNSTERGNLKPILKKPQIARSPGLENLQSVVEISLDEGSDEDEHSDVSQVETRKVPRTVRDKLAEDDAEIAVLEKKLGLKGKKKLPKSFLEDGLDDLLGDLESDAEATARKRKREEEEWLKDKRQKARVNIENSEDDSLHEEATEASDNSEFEGFDDVEEYLPDLQQTKQKENPYRPPIAVSSSPSTKYIPPSKRVGACAESDSEMRLRRQIKGHLNKLSEANIVSILSDIEKLYQEYPRQTVTAMLIDLLLGLICSGSGLNDTFIILHAGFITGIFKVIGMEFGAELAQNVVTRFDKMFGNGHPGDSDRKDMTNLISLLSHLYNFHVVGCGLIFDFIRLFLEEINEMNTDLLLKIVRNSGPQLRQDDPSALKDIVLLIQPAVARVGEAALSVRTKFMIETITDLKNNRVKNAPGASISSEHIIKMRKIIGSLNTRSLKATEPLRIGHADIRDSDKKGKWWLVGASWRAEPLPSTDTKQTSINSSVVLPSTLNDDLGDMKDVDLVQLARTHRMNTEVRRSIFIAIMSASDYQDAHMRLSKLHLKRSQETEIPHVLIHCVSEEETYNPYYTFIARKLCGERRMKMAFQFSLWDAFKQMGERADVDDSEDFDENRQLNMRAIVNLAKMYGSLIADGGLTLGVLKTLNFLYLQPKTKTFVELLLITAMQQTQKKASRRQQRTGSVGENNANEKALVNMFSKTQDTPQVKPGLIYFIRKVVAKSDVITLEGDKVALKRGCRLALDTLKMIP
ncbi:suppressor of glycerol defect [Ophidiomyces ophidiicola]|nr:suppressor of glycerol defect [Ophidiomyces ophidiicola]